MKVESVIAPCPCSNHPPTTNQHCLLCSIYSDSPLWGDDDNCVHRRISLQRCRGKFSLHYEYNLTESEKAQQVIKEIQNNHEVLCNSCILYCRCERCYRHFPDHLYPTDSNEYNACQRRDQNIVVGRYCLDCV